MSHLVNPFLVHGYVDENDTSSAQGCVIGDNFSEIEKDAERAVQEQRMQIYHTGRILKEYREIDDRIAEAVRKRWKRKLAELIERKEELKNFLEQKKLI